MIKYPYMQGGLWGKLRENVRDVVFGLEDSLVSTLGTVTGVAVGTQDVSLVVLSGIILIVVEAISMAAGSYLSSKSATELYQQRAKQDHARVLSENVSDKESLVELFRRKGFSAQEVSIAVAAIGRERALWLKEVARCEYRHAPTMGSSPVMAGAVMGVFYLLGGVITMIPYLFLPIAVAIPAAIALALVALFFVGVLKAKLTGANPWRSGGEMLAISTAAAGIGYVLGLVIPRMFEIIAQ